MSVRATHIIEDIEKCVFALISKLCTTTSPWTSWTPYMGWPEVDIDNEFTEPIIYILNPFLTSSDYIQGGLSTKSWEMIIGAWDHRKVGGTEEINIIGSRLLNLFGDPQTVNTTQFNVTLSEAFTNTTLKAQGCYVLGIIGPRDIATEDLKEFRREFTISLRT